MDKVLITGTTSGLGASLSKIYEDGGYSVHSISKKASKSSAIHRDCDLEDLDSVRSGIDSLVKTHCYEYVFLNAGVLGELSVGADVHLRDYEKAFDVNVWSNKIIIDSLIRHKRAKNIINNEKCPIPGFVVLAKRGKHTYHKAFGFSDKEKNIPKKIYIINNLNINN